MIIDHRVYVTVFVLAYFTALATTGHDRLRKALVVIALSVVVIGYLDWLWS